MALPEIKRPIFTMIMPSREKEVSFRPFLVGEEKILLMAQESGEDTDIVRAIKQILGNVVKDPWFNPSMLTTFDLEYMFLKLRAKSISNIMELAYIDNEDGEKYEFQVDLNTVEVQWPAKVPERKIKASDDVGLVLRYPTVNLLTEIGDVTETELVDRMLIGCIESIWDADTVYPADEQTREDLEAFVDSLDVETYDKIKDFFTNLPVVSHTIEYKNKLGNDRKIELRSLRDFFLWA